jgi:hypothetical protein
MLPPTLDVVVSISGASPVTVTVSCQRRGRQLEVDGPGFAHEQIDARAVHGAETGKLGGDSVRAHTHRQPIHANPSVTASKLFPMLR